MTPGGCQSKICATDLIAALSQVLPVLDVHDFQDSHTLELPPGVGQIQTSVDLIYDMGIGYEDLGYIAVVHSLSDIYASLADPFAVLWVVGCPPQMAESSLAQIVKGAVTAANDHGLQFGGGHSVLSDTSFVSVTSIGARTKDVYLEPDVAYDYILTKPLGSGLGIAGVKEGMLTQEEQSDLKTLMKQSNSIAAIRAQGFSQSGDVGVVTDVTGFGLIYALWSNLAQGWRAVMRVEDIPVMNFARRMTSEHGLVTVLGERNWLDLREAIHVSPALSWTEGLLLSDPQTSGGLLFAVKRSASEGFLKSINGHLVGGLEYAPEDSGLYLMK